MQIIGGVPSVEIDHDEKIAAELARQQRIAEMASKWHKELENPARDVCGR